MGGIASGRRWRFDARPTTEDFRQIDIRQLNRQGAFDPTGSYSIRWVRLDEIVASITVRTDLDRILLIYWQRARHGDWENVSYPVCLDWTDCHLGGKRPWFLCPGEGCRRRVAFLYFGDFFVCRHCHGLAYPSQREEAYDRAARRADRIREKLDWEPGILNGNGWKPKGMHWQTFRRLSAEHDRHVRRSLAGFGARYGISDESIMQRF